MAATLPQVSAPGERKKRRRLAEAEAEAELREILERNFEAYWEPLENVTAFKYLRRVLTAGNDDWLVVVGNLGKARKSCGAVIADIEPGGGGSESVGTSL